MAQETKAETFEVELFIHNQNIGGNYVVSTHDMCDCGYPLLGTQVVTLDCPVKDAVEAEVEMLDKKEASLIKEHLAQLYTIQQRKKDLLCLEVKSEG